MPRCRPCLRQKLTGYPQESHQLIKYAHPSSSIKNPRLILNTPTYVGAFSQRFIHQHLPNLFHLARSRGDRVLQPLDFFQPSFQHFGDDKYYSLALDWVVTRVSFFAKNDFGFGNSFNVWSPIPTGRAGGGEGLNPENVMQHFYWQMQEYYNMGDYAGSDAMLDRGVGILEAIGNVIRTETGTSYSDQLMNDYLETVIPFLSWAENIEPRSTFRLLKAVYRATGENPVLVVQMCNNLGPVGRDEAAMEAFNHATMYNDRISWEVYEAIP